MVGMSQDRRILQLDLCNVRSNWQATVTPQVGVPGLVGRLRVKLNDQRVSKAKAEPSHRANAFPRHAGNRAIEFFLGQ